MLHLPVHPCLFEFIQEHRVRLAQHVQPRLRHRSQAPHGQTRTGERVPPDQVFGQAEFQTQAADLVLEQIAQRLDQLEPEFSGQPADVVVRLDRRSWSIGVGSRFNDIGVERPLSQEVGVRDRLRLVAEHLDEHATDDLPLLLRVGDSS